MRYYSQQQDGPKKKSIGQMIKDKTSPEDTLKRINEEKERKERQEWENRRQKQHEKFKRRQRYALGVVTIALSTVLLYQYREYLKNPKGHVFDALIKKVLGRQYRDYISVRFPFEIVNGSVGVFFEGLEHMATKKEHSEQEKKLYHDFYTADWPWFRLKLPSMGSIQRPGMVLNVGGNVATGGVMIEDALSNITHLAYIKADEDKVKKYGADTHEKRQFQMILDDYLAAGFKIEKNKYIPSNLHHNTIDIAILVRDDFMKNEIGHFDVEGHPKLLPSNEEWMAIASMYGPDGYIYVGARTYPTAGINAALLHDAGGPEPPQHWSFPSTYEHEKIEDYLLTSIEKLMKEDLLFDNKPPGSRKVTEFSREQAFQMINKRSH